MRLKPANGRVTLAAAAGQAALAQRNEELLELYRAQKPYHEPKAKAVVR